VERRRFLQLAGATVAAPVLLDTPLRAQPADPLPSWNAGAAKQAILDFVTKVANEGSPDFVPLPERIAVFDNDGTLWSEKPMYFQLAFSLDRVRALAPKYPAWKTTQPFKGILEQDMKAVAAAGEAGLMKVLAATHLGNTSEEFTATVNEWITTARHPKTNKLYTEMVFQPMLEVLAYLRASGFKTFIVSGGGVEFMRPWTERVYGIPPEQVVGSRAKMRYELRGDTPVIVRLEAVDLVDDKAGKPVGIQQQIGRRPVMAFGNSDGDYEMLRWTTAGKGARFGLIVHHTDAAREWAYDRASHVGTLARALDEAPARGWVLADMKNDWKTIYPA
jgi:phosphoserine phosphatase